MNKHLVFCGGFLLPLGCRRAEGECSKHEAGVVCTQALSWLQTPGLVGIRGCSGTRGVMPEVGVNLPRLLPSAAGRQCSEVIKELPSK